MLSQEIRTTPYRLEGLELASGFVLGYEDAPMPPDDGRGPRQVLEDLLRESLQAAPCMVAFSGGRDSSAILAVAVHVARDAGLPLPIPLTLRYPQAARSDESSWQQLVLDHLGLRNQEVITVGTEHNPIGPWAAPVLRRHGVIWPPNFAPTVRMMDTARGGVLVTGEGGDELFGPRRLSPLFALLGTVAARRVPERKVVRQAARQLLAPAVRRRRTTPAPGATWLRESAYRAVFDGIVADHARPSVHAGRATWQGATRRVVRILPVTFGALGTDIGAGYSAPLCEPSVAAALSRHQGWRPPAGRTEAMTTCFGDVLPREILSRADKAGFRDAILTPELQQFAADWDVSGLDRDLIDVDVLRSAWQAGNISPLTIQLLQAAWLHSLG